MSKEKKGRFGKILKVVLLVLISLFIAFYFFQKAQYKQAKITLPNTHLLALKINYPIELENKNKPLFDWVKKQAIYSAYELCEPYFSKGLQQKDYSIEDLLGDKSIIFCLDDNKNSLVYIPLSNNDDYFTKPILAFFETKPKGISKNGKTYTITQNKQQIHFYIDENLLLFSSSKQAIENALLPNDNTELSDLISEENQLLLNLSSLDKLFSSDNYLTKKINHLAGKSGFMNTTFDFDDGEILFSGITKTNSLLPLIKQDEVETSLINHLPITAINLSLFSTENAHQLDESLQEHWKTNSNGSLDLRIDAKENFGFNSSDFFDYLDESIAVIDYNIKKSTLSQFAILELKEELPTLWFSKAKKHNEGKDTIYSLPNFSFNRTFFGDLIGSTKLSYFFQKGKKLFLFETLYSAQFYLKNETNSWKKSKEKKKILKQLQDEGQFSFCTFPAKNTGFLKRASRIDIPLWKFVNEINRLHFSWIEKEYKGKLVFSSSAYEETKTAKFIPIYKLDDSQKNHQFYLKPHQLTPNLISYQDNKLKILDYLGNTLKEHQLNGDIISIVKNDAVFYIQTTEKNYSFNSKWNIIQSFGIEEITTEDYLGYLMKRNETLFFYQYDDEVIIKNEKGKTQKEIELEKGLINKHFIDGKLYFSHISDNLLTIFNEKGKKLKRYPQNLEDLIALPPYSSHNKIQLIYENGLIENFHTKEKRKELNVQLLGKAQLVKHKNKPLYLAESSTSKVNVYTTSFQKLFTIREPFSEQLIVTALTSDYILLHDKIKKHAFICNKKGHFLTTPFDLSENGQVILSKNRLYRLDNLQGDFELEYLKI